MNDHQATSNVRPTPAEAVPAMRSAIADLLGRIPEHWGAWESDALTDMETRALFMLVAAGLVQRRGRFRLQFAGHPVMMEATFEATGEYGIVEAIQPMAAALYKDWKDVFHAWQRSPDRHIMPLYAERGTPDEWRLTAEGVQAEKDVREGGVLARHVFDFVMKVGTLADRPPVRGKGKLARMERTTQTPPTGANPRASDNAGEQTNSMNVGNWGEGGEALAKAFAPMFQMMFEQMQAKQAAEEQDADASSADDEVDQVPALTESERITLCALNTFDAAMLASATRIGEAIEPAKRLSDRTITKAIGRLIQLGLAERPQGDRQGARLTLRGRRLVAKVAD